MATKPTQPTTEESVQPIEQPKPIDRSVGVPIEAETPMYRMLVNWRYGAFYPLHSVSDLALVPIAIIDSAIESGYMERL